MTETPSDFADARRTTSASEPYSHRGRGGTSGPGVFGPAAGFTLVELMTVVAVIGVLVAIAVPSYVSFMCRSKQGEAKSGLGTLFVTEKTFFAEHNTFATDLVNLNWKPEGEPLYLFGFKDPGYPTDAPLGITNWDPERKSTVHASVIGSPSYYSTSRMVDLGGTALDNTDLPASFAEGQQFLIGAAADPGPDAAGSVILDLWSINHRREMNTVQNDCAIGI